MLRIITLNLNGIRSALAKGFPRWLARQRADLVCLQEIKAQEGDLADLTLIPRGYHGHYHCCSTKRGYSGVALYSRAKPENVSCGYGSREFDPEGRFLRADFGGLSVVSVYLPSGSSSEERQQAKFRFLGEFMPVLKKLKASGREFVLCGDWNIAHKEIDQELALEPEELGIPSRGAGMAHRRIRQTGLGRRVPPRGPAAGAVHVVVESRPGVG